MQHFINAPYYQCTILSTHHFINPPFYQCTILSMWHFVNAPFYQCAILSMCHFTMNPFWQLMKNIFYYKKGLSWVRGWDQAQLNEELTLMLNVRLGHVHWDFLSFSCKNEMIQNGKLGSWKNGKLKKCQVDKMSSWQNGKFKMAS